MVLDQIKSLDFKNKQINKQKQMPEPYLPSTDSEFLVYRWGEYILKIKKYVILMYISG